VLYILSTYELPSDTIFFVVPALNNSKNKNKKQKILCLTAIHTYLFMYNLTWNGLVDVGV
jgi:hypothetical protein